MSEVDASISCQELVELVTAYLEEMLPRDDRARFEEHLAGCEGCFNYLEQMRTTIRLTGMLSPQSLSPAAEGALLSAFRTWKA
jgi:anti-sigma factor RsiW